MRHIILHHHIFKNAGTTLDSALETHFGAAFTTLHNGTSGVVTNDMLASFLFDNHNIFALSSHHFQCQKYFSMDGNMRFFNLALLRDPVERILSMYAFYRRTQSADMLSISAKEKDINAFLEFIIGRFPHIADNWQTNILANHGFYCRPVSNADLAKASKRYSKFSLCATVDRYDEAMVMLEHILYPTFPSKPIDFAYIAQNVTTYQNRSEELSVSNIRPKLLESFRELNRFDLLLCEYARVELERRYRTIPNRDSRLGEFRDRCAKLQSAQMV
ncbi:sulfotransferase family 2 domain-containing protein [Lichenihabitans psoromatis]|uniref:sulfotransferase family 2 domain-containing protein n=1 Tax=Lichenihabitans psoromatis TaxID=2528642 RepID=UPI0010382DBF|nr:sulfotransferase family 2 domain-containing protein [Lichenihabitans psoromatis]